MALNITMLGVLAILAVCQQTGCCKGEIAALKGVEQDVYKRQTDAEKGVVESTRENAMTIASIFGLEDHVEALKIGRAHV